MVSPPEKVSYPNPIEKHPPERRQRKKEFVVLYSCCCCCCCCLHTLGGAVGAAWAGDFRAESDPSEFPQKTYPSSQTMFRNCFLLTILFGAFVGAVPWSLVSPVVIGLSVILLGPLWFLAASVVMAIWLALREDLPHKSEYWRQLGRITLGNVAGTVAGVVVMFLIFSAMK